MRSARQATEKPFRLDSHCVLMDVKLTQTHEIEQTHEQTNEQTHEIEVTDNIMLYKVWHGMRLSSGMAEYNLSTECNLCWCGKNILEFNHRNDKSEIYMAKHGLYVGCVGMRLPNVLRSRNTEAYPRPFSVQTARKLFPATLYNVHWPSGLPGICIHWKEQSPLTVTHAYIHTYIHTHTHTHIHTYICGLMSAYK